MANIDTQLLLFLLRNDEGACPPSAQVRHSSPRLYEKAILNKVPHALAHFVKCRSCYSLLKPTAQKKIAQLQKISLLSQFLYEREKQQLVTLMKKHKIRGIFFKDSAEKLRRKFFLTTDIDFLLDPKSAEMLDIVLTEQGYRKKAYPPKEITYSQKGRLHIDVHTLLAYPHFESLTKSEQNMIADLSAETLSPSSQHKQNSHELKKENLLFVLCVRYLLNDLMTGLGGLEEIVRLARALTPTQWRSFLQRAQRYHFSNEALFLMATGSQVFQIPLPSRIRSALSWKTKLMSAYVQPEWLAEFPKLKQWTWEKNRTMAHRHYKRLGIMKLILSEKTPYTRLIRPKIIVTLTDGFWKRFYEHAQ